MTVAQNMDGQFALEMQGLQRLKHSARQDPASGAGEAARQFEALFIQMMVKSMRQAVPDGGLLNSQQGEFYQSLLDQQWSQTMASRGIGLADTLVNELERRGAVPASDHSNAAAALIAGIPRGVPQVLRGAIQPGEPSPEVSAPGAPRSFMDEIMPPAPRSGGAAQSTATQDRADHVQAFLERLAEPAQAASRTTGVPAELILAQAALETGWGRHEIPTHDGGNSHNLFGIKAGSRWSGETTEITTHEVYHGQRQQVRDAFRVYGSFEEAFIDYARLIGDNPRYAAVTTAASASEAAHALQRGGYATDPAYADKLIAVMRSMGPLEAAPQQARTPAPNLAMQPSQRPENPAQETSTPLASAGSIGLGLLR